VVAPVDNLTQLAGEVLAVEPHPSLAGYAVVRLAVRSAEPVEGRADLLSRRAGQELDVAVPSALLSPAAPGSRLACRARLTARGVLCEPHPPPGAFTLAP